MSPLKLALLKKNIELVKEKMSDYDFSCPNSMVNMCSYTAIQVGEKIWEMGEDSYTTILISINDSFIDNSSPLKSNKNDNHNHNVILYDDFVIDLTRKQFGNLIGSDITHKDEYFSLGWNFIKENKFKKKQKNQIKSKP